MTVLEQIKLGGQGHSMSRLGMGCWAIGGHGWGFVDEKDAICAVRYAFENGVTFFDTADAYGLGTSELILAKALESNRKKVVIATKGGVRWDPRGKVWTDISPTYLRSALEASLRRLKLERIALYYIHKPDGVTAIEDSVAALERMREEGKIGALGIANCSPEQLNRALTVAPVSAVQVRLNMLERQACEELLHICESRSITLVAWGVLGDGLLTGKFTAKTKFGEDDHRSRMPGLNVEELLENLRTVASLESLAASRNRSLAQMALRWVLDHSPVTAPLFGAKTHEQVMQNLGADGWTLTSEELATIDTIFFSRR